jgi:integral membrane sensor domain MASE1
MWPAPLWLPAGIAMFATFSMGKSSWPGILLGSSLTDTIAFGVPGPWAAVSLGNTLAPMAAVEVVRSRFCVEKPFEPVADALYFCLAALLQGGFWDS